MSTNSVPSATSRTPILGEAERERGLAGESRRRAASKATLAAGLPRDEREGAEQVHEERDVLHVNPSWLGEDDLAAGGVS